MNNNIFTLVPTFMSGVKALHADLIGVAFVLCIVGLLFHTITAMVRKDLAVMFPTLVRLAVISILIGSLQTWGDTLVGAVNGLIADMGAGGSGGNIFEDYQAAIARKMGTAAAAANANQIPSQSAQPNQPAPSPLPDPNQPLTGTMLTHYAYLGDSTPDGTPGNPGSAQGVGAFSFDSTPGSLIPMYSAALTASAAKQYNLTPGQSFTITSGGQTYNLEYADVAPESDSRIDIYDPNGQLPGGNSFSEAVSSVNGGPVVQGQTGTASLMPNPGGSIGDQIMWAITLALSWIASGIMYLMQIAQQLLYLIEIAISPIFIGFLMIPALTHLARRFFMTLVAICLWSLAWAVCDLVTKFLIDLAVNPTNNAGVGIAGAAAVASGPLAGLAYLIIIALWVIGSTFLAPVFIGILLAVGGGTATAAIFGATLGAAATRTGAMAGAAVGGSAGVANVISGVGGAISARSASRMNGATVNHAARPMASQNGQTKDG
jgi:hypothetical protein